jgi:uncharacterized protein with ACT and thioredoxin-like domain
MCVTPFVDEVMRACEGAVARREPCTVVAVVLGQGDAERVAQWCRTEAARLGAVYELATPLHAFDVAHVRVRVLSLAEAVRAIPRLPRHSVVVVDAGARIHADLEGVWPTLQEMVVACQG